ncbi:hypothetical protein CEXT_134291 [Caerostris extrusa]|uniref:Uncharacterized protein n=1 Tax=Caerostris extrusa TaxID=172846 RepID=A0AAV4XJ90_CAEEX|nr:hypothetical protein CEXT_134291 [Caerostris extrusa]
MFTREVSKELLEILSSRSKSVCCTNSKNVHVAVLLKKCRATPPKMVLKPFLRELSLEINPRGFPSLSHGATGQRNLLFGP